MDRKQEFQNLANHPWFGKQVKRLRPPARELALKFLEENREVSHDEFIPRVNRMFLDQKKPAQWEIVLDLLTAASVAAVEKKYAVKEKGTPKNLDEAIVRALEGETTDQAYYILKDFLAQRFGVAMLTTNGDGDHLPKQLESLFQEIVRREK